MLKEILSIVDQAILEFFIPSIISSEYIIDQCSCIFILFILDITYQIRAITYV
jgi:hypothetical protein